MDLKRLLKQKKIKVRLLSTEPSGYLLGASITDYSYASM
nr:MAG TPA: YlzJ-like protein [Caudoviricetes sp.]